ncbi:MAG: D-alanine--D-alanine ligase [Gemmatimonadota bacterium]|nr:D-alanine--D-alanine ligase [Gemmatimonadota bacterium]
MTRIGFAFNLKPESDVERLPRDGEAPRPDEEPPSTRRAIAARLAAAPSNSDGAGALLSATTFGPRRPRPAPSGPSDLAAPDDEFAEWDSEETVGAVEQALGAVGEVIRLEAGPAFPERLRAEGPDIVFNIAEGMGTANREAHVPAICEFFGIPYSGSDPLTLSLCLDKSRTKEILSYHGVPTARFVVVARKEELRDANWEKRAGRARTRISKLASLRFPLFAKPLHEGSSKGITERSLVRTPEELEAQVEFLLERYAQPVLVEEFLPGAEFTCAVLGNDIDARVLPLVGMNFDALPEGALPIYGFEAKWLWDRPERPLEIFHCPARIDRVLERRINEVVLSAYRALGCRDWSRIDVRLDAARVPNVVEVNPLPGILPDPADNSCFPKAARAAGMGYDELIQTCLRHAAERQGVTLPPVAASDIVGAAALG